MRIEMDFPSPDDLNDFEEEEKRQVELVRKLDEDREAEQFLLELSSLLKDPNTRPAPESDGWVYCHTILLPTHVENGTDHWNNIQRFLAKAKWNAEIFSGTPECIKSDPNNTLWTLFWNDADYNYIRIRRTH